MTEEGTGLLGWATNDLVGLDTLAPGLISRLLVASPPARRHAIFSVLANCTAFRSIDFADADAVRTATILRDGRAQDILLHGFGCIPDRWLGALDRLGPSPMDRPMSYLKLYAIFGHAHHKRAAEALQYVGAIKERMLALIDVLDPRWLHPSLLKRFKSPVAAEDFNRTMAYVQAHCSTATDESIITAIARLRPGVPLDAFVTRLIRRADTFPAHPMTETEIVKPLVSGRDFLLCSRRYRNCLMTKLEDALAGQVAFAEVNGQCIAELRPLSNGVGWILRDIHVKNNDFADDETQKLAKEACLMQGIPSVGGALETDDMERVRRFLRNARYMDEAA